MVKYMLTQKDKEHILNEYVFTVSGVSDADVEYILAFLDKYKYHYGYKPSFYFKRPKDWTPAYIQAIDKVVCFFKYGDYLNNGSVLHN